MSWLSKATGIHWGNIGPEVGAVLGSVVPGIGTALGAELGSIGGSLANHQNNTIGNLANIATTVGTNLPGGVGDAIRSGFSKVGSALPGATAAGDWLGSVGAGPIKTVSDLLPHYQENVPGVSTPPTSGGQPGTDLSHAGLMPNSSSGSSLPTSGLMPGSTNNTDLATAGLGNLGDQTSTAAVGQAITEPTTGKIDWAKVAKIGLTVAQALEAANAAQKQGQLMNASQAQWQRGENIIMNPAPLPGLGGSVKGPTAVPTNAVAAQQQALQQLLLSQQAAARAAGH